MLLSRLCLFAAVFSFSMCAAAAAPLHVLPKGDADIAHHAYALSEPELLCTAIRELDHDICGTGKEAFVPLCHALSEINSTLCSNETATTATAATAAATVAHVDGTVCPLIIFIDKMLCSNSTTPTTYTAPPTITPSDFCPIIELAHRELCGGNHAKHTE